MAFYIQILKIEESGNKAMYRFHGDAGTAGVFEIDKSTGESKLVEPMAGEPRLRWLGSGEKGGSRTFWNGLHKKWLRLLG